MCVCVKLLQVCPTLCDPMDFSLPGSSAHGILQARILKWVAMSSSRGSSRPRDQTCISSVSCINRRVLYLLHPLGSSHSFLWMTGASQSISFYGSVVKDKNKKPTCQCRRPEVDPWVRKIPWKRKWQPNPVFLCRKSHG